MDRSLSTIDTIVIHSLSLSLRLLRLALDPSPSPPLLSLSVSPRFIVRETNENSSSKIEWKTSSNFHGFDFSNARNCYSDGNVGYYETGGQSVRGLIMRYASRSFSILASPAYHGFHVTAPITEINTVGLDLIAVCVRERPVVKFLILFDSLFSSSSSSSLRARFNRCVEH